MASVYSVALGAYHGIVDPVTITLPDDVLTIVRDIEVFFASALPATLNVVGDAGQTWFYVQYPSSFDEGEQYWQWSGRHVIGPGGTITLSPGGAGCDVSLSGYQLSLP